MAAEAMVKIGQAPADLGHAVARGGQRQDRMMEGLRQRVAVAAQAPGAGPIRFDQTGVGVRMRFLQPGEQGRAEIK